MGKDRLEQIPRKRRSGIFAHITATVAELGESERQAPTRCVTLEGGSCVRRAVRKPREDRRQRCLKVGSPEPSGRGKEVDSVIHSDRAS